MQIILFKSVPIALTLLPLAAAQVYDLVCNGASLNQQDIYDTINEIFDLGEDPLTVGARGRALVEQCGSSNEQCARISLRALNNKAASAPTKAVADAILYISDACGERGGSRSASAGFANMVVHVNDKYV